MINPIRYRREHLGISQEILARNAGVTRQVVTLAEQGLYNSPPSSLVSVLGHDTLVADYHTWVNQKRYENKHLFDKVDLRLAKVGHEFSTLKNQVAGKSNQAFCRALVYQPSLVREFEKYGRGSAGIFTALSEVGVGRDDLERLIRNSNTG